MCVCVSVCECVSEFYMHSIWNDSVTLCEGITSIQNIIFFFFDKHMLLNKEKTFKVYQCNNAVFIEF